MRVLAQAELPDTVERDGLQIVIGTIVIGVDNCATSHDRAKKRQVQIIARVDEMPSGGTLFNIYLDTEIDFAMPDEERQRIIDETVNEMLQESQKEIGCMREARQFEREASECLDSAVAKCVSQISE